MMTTNIQPRSSNFATADPAVLGGTRLDGRVSPSLISNIDRRRLTVLLELGRHVDETAAALLRRKLKQAHVVAAATMPPTVVTMNSRVLCRDLATGAERELTLVYPCSCGPERGHVSVLSRAGIDLLSATPGDSMPRFELGTWHVKELLYQPEAEADYHL